MVNIGCSVLCWLDYRKGFATTSSKTSVAGRSCVIWHLARRKCLCDCHMASYSVQWRDASVSVTVTWHRIQSSGETQVSLWLSHSIVFSPVARRKCLCDCHMASYSVQWRDASVSVTVTWHRIQSSGFCRVRECDRRADGRTDHTVVTSVALAGMADAFSDAATSGESVVYVCVF